jgi:hypothetical protein
VTVPSALGLPALFLQTTARRIAEASWGNELGAPVVRASTANALRLLRHLDVRRERKRGYDRAKFADWYDADHDGCDTREEVLIAESVTRVRVGSSCSIRGGKWFSKYDGKSTRNSSTFDIDHLVPLAEAWVSGARRWGKAKRASSPLTRPRWPAAPRRCLR